MNVVIVRGTLSRAPEQRQLPSGDQLVQYEVTVRDADRPTESVPVVWFDPPARASKIASGAEVVVTGRIRRRFFRTQAGTGSRTEVVAGAVVPATQHKRVLGALGAAIDAISTETAGPGSS